MLPDIGTGTHPKSGYVPDRIDILRKKESLFLDWLEIAVQVSAEEMETVSDILIEMGTGGVVIEDPALILQYARESHPDEWDVPEAAVSGRHLVKGYLPCADGLFNR